MYFLPKIIMGGGIKFLNYIFYQKMLKNISIFRVFHFAKYLDG